MDNNTTTLTVQQAREIISAWRGSDSQLFRSLSFLDALQEDQIVKQAITENWSQRKLDSYLRRRQLEKSQEGSLRILLRYGIFPEATNWLNDMPDDEYRRICRLGYELNSKRLSGQWQPGDQEAWRELHRQYSSWEEKEWARIQQKYREDSARNDFFLATGLKIESAWPADQQTEITRQLLEIDGKIRAGLQPDPGDYDLPAAWFDQYMDRCWQAWSEEKESQRRREKRKAWWDALTPGERELVKARREAAIPSQAWDWSKDLDRELQENGLALSEGYRTFLELLYHLTTINDFPPRSGNSRKRISEAVKPVFLEFIRLLHETGFEVVPFSLKFVGGEDGNLNIDPSTVARAIQWLTDNDFMRFEGGSGKMVNPDENGFNLGPDPYRYSLGRKAYLIVWDFEVNSNFAFQLPEKLPGKLERNLWSELGPSAMQIYYSMNGKKESQQGLARRTRRNRRTVAKALEALESANLVERHGSRWAKIHLEI